MAPVQVQQEDRRRGNEGMSSIDFCYGDVRDEDDNCRIVYLELRSGQKFFNIQDDKEILRDSG